MYNVRYEIITFKDRDFMTEHYLDNSATTAVCREAAEKALEMMTVKYGNPSSLHNKGMEAEDETERARETIAKSLGVNPEEIFFTSGGTEANNTALIGAAHAARRKGNKIVISAVEHSSVLETAESLEKEGFEIVKIYPDERGNISAKDIEEAVDENTILVSIMTVNNETGAIFPTDKISKIIKRKKSPALFHTDCVQAYGKIPLKNSKLSADLITVSGHKVHGPKGVGALYIRKGVRILPLLHGGEQQKKIRPGTEGVPLICAFGAAVSLFNIEENLKHVQTLRDYALEQLLKIDGVKINSPEDCLPYIINLSVLGIKSETMLHHLASTGVYISSSSACAKGQKSYVLKAMMLSDQRIDSALRISFSKYSTKEDIDALVQGIKSGCETLVRKKYS